MVTRFEPTISSARDSSIPSGRDVSQRPASSRPLQATQEPKMASRKAAYVNQRLGKWTVSDSAAPSRRMNSPSLSYDPPSRPLSAPYGSHQQSSRSSPLGTAMQSFDDANRYMRSNPYGPSSSARSRPSPFVMSDESIYPTSTIHSSGRPSYPKQAYPSFGVIPSRHSAGADPGAPESSPFSKHSRREDSSVPQQTTYADPSWPFSSPVSPTTPMFMDHMYNPPKSQQTQPQQQQPPQRPLEPNSITLALESISDPPARTSVHDVRGSYEPILKDAGSRLDRVRWSSLASR